VRQGHGQSGVNREYVLSTVAAIETEGFRDPQWHQLAMTLHDVFAHFTLLCGREDQRE
jgi:glutathione-specific gamma-glutamylcyclotransferase